MKVVGVRGKNVGVCLQDVGVRGKEMGVRFGVVVEFGVSIAFEVGMGIGKSVVQLVIGVLEVFFIIPKNFTVSSLNVATKFIIFRLGFIRIKYFFYFFLFL